MKGLDFETVGVMNLKVALVDRDVVEGYESVIGRVEFTGIWSGRLHIVVAATQL